LVGFSGWSYRECMSLDDNTTAPRQGLSVAALGYGIFLLIALFVLMALVAGFGIGTPELVLWLVLLAGWVTFWMLRRRR